MKPLLLSLLLFTSCTIDTPIVPECHHEVSWIPAEDIVRVCIVSDSPSTEVCLLYGNERYCTAIQRHYYGCTNWKISKGLTAIEIITEQTCTYTY